MERVQKFKRPAGRDERHSAAWGKRLSMLVLLLVAEAALAQGSGVQASSGGSKHRLSPELRRLVAHPDTAAANPTVKVIVQYRQAPKAEHYAKMQNRGGHLHMKLDVIQGASFTIPESALPALEADPEIVSVSIDHPLHLMDDLTNGATGVAAAWNSGFTGAGVGVAVIDSGIYDNHPDLWNSTQTASRVVYHQDFTGTASTNLSGANHDLYGHGTHVAGII